MKPDAEAVLPRLDRFEAEARSRGVTHTTFRHLTEDLNLNGSQRDALRQLLIERRPSSTAVIRSSTTRPLAHHDGCVESQSMLDGPADA
ncbi:hypothetical protein [Streptomyces sp. NRRL B-2790]|uniref:hypothetical protein n=1 Tax=Streptomyces sp. NRRL B-2790 TaxID=1463835 RepID=UPI000A950D32